LKAGFLGIGRRPHLRRRWAADPVWGVRGRRGTRPGVSEVTRHRLGAVPSRILTCIGTVIRLDQGAIQTAIRSTIRAW